MLTILNNKIRISDSTITSHHDEDSWVFKITDILSHKPEKWKELIKEKKCFTIVKTEFEELTKAKSHLELHPEDGDDDYREHLIHLASACINALMEL